MWQNVKIRESVLKTRTRNSMLKVLGEDATLGEIAQKSEADLRQAGGRIGRQALMDLREILESARAGQDIVHPRYKALAHE